MTVENDDTVERYTIVGQGPYAYSYRIFNDEDLAVTVCSTDTPPVPTLLTYLTHYTVSGKNDLDGGTIMLSAAAATTYAGFTLDIRSNTPNVQDTSIRNIGRFLPEIHENAFDNLSRQVQDLERRVRAAIRFPDNQLNDGMMTPIAGWLGKYLTINNAGLLEAAELTPDGALTATDVGVLLSGSPSAQGVIADLIAGELSTESVTQALLASLMRTPAEVAAGVIPVDYSYPPYDARRYGAVGDDATNNDVALQNWLNASVGQTCRLPKGIYRISTRLSVGNSTVIIGDGRECSYLKYVGTTTITNGSMLYFPLRSAFRVSHMSFVCTGAVIGNTTVMLNIEDCVYGEVDNISFRGSGALSNTNSLKGLWINQTTDGFVPPRGSINVRNILYVVEPTDSGAILSRAIHVQGHPLQAIEYVTLTGEGNLEHAYRAVHFQNASNCFIGPNWQLRGATNGEIVLTTCANILILAPMLAPAPVSGTGVIISSDTFDTTIIAVSFNFSSGAPLAPFSDLGVRTNILFPGAAGAGLPQGKIFGTHLVTDSDNVASQKGTWEVAKNAGYDKNVIVARDEAVPATGVKALFKGERGGASIALLMLDINGVNKVAVTSTGRLVAVAEFQAPVILTANLPAAGAAQDGLVIVENGGAGNGNIVFYVGGQRFRIDGGAAV